MSVLDSVFRLHDLYKSRYFPRGCERYLIGTLFIVWAEKQGCSFLKITEGRIITEVVAAQVDHKCMVTHSVPKSSDLAVLTNSSKGITNPRSKICGAGFSAALKDSGSVDFHWQSRL